MELCDVLDESGMPTGQTVGRGTLLPKGNYYLAVQVWIRNEAREYLIQQRGLHLKSAPGIWATTAGMVVAGEESISGAMREVMEELGISLEPAQLTRFERFKMEKQIEDVWIAEVSKAAVTPVMSDEVNAWKWASRQEIDRMISRGEFFRYSYMDRLPE